MSRQINGSRLVIPLAIATCIALTVWAPASAAVSPRLAVVPSSRGLMPALPGAHVPPLNLMRPRVIAGNTSTPTIPLYELASSYTNVKTVNGVPWSELIDATKNTSTSAASVGVILARHNPGFSQFAENYWNFNKLVTSDFTVTGAGNATVTLKAAQIGPFGSLSGTFTPSASHAMKCSSGSGTVYSGVLQLTSQHFVTSNTKEASTLGTVSASVTFPNNSSTNTSTLTVDHSCVPAVSYPNYCLLGNIWSNPYGSIMPNKSFLGEALTTESPTPTTFADVEAFRDVTITGLPAGAGFGGGTATLMRFDTDVDPSFTNQTWIGGTASPYPMTEKMIAPSSDAYFQGSATMTSKTSTSFDFGSCKAGSAKKTQHYRYTTGTYSWSNGSKPLTADSAVGGNFTYPNMSGVANGDIERYSYS
ncbi:MAG TPA: hypothetical protein VFB34_03415 [Chloroflexota bacterium]|nr:hypothetical protein [Chloroflexota bacterium]